MVTDFSFGFDTAVNIVTEAVDRLRTTTESHRRIMVVETMGRHVGLDRLLLRASPSGPTISWSPRSPSTCPTCSTSSRGAGRRQEIRDRDRRRGGPVPRPRPVHPRRRARPLRQPPPRRHRQAVADAIEKQTRLETRVVVLGHLQRGGPPSAYDRILATRLGLAASRLVLQRRFGTIVTLLKARSARPSSARSTPRTRPSTSPTTTRPPPSSTEPAANRGLVRPQPSGMSENPEKTTEDLTSGRTAAMMTLASLMTIAANGRDGLCRTTCRRPVMSKTPATFIGF